MNARGFTLVELMVTVAIIGILGLLFSSVSINAEQRAQEELQRARAEVLAGAVLREAATGQPLAGETRARLEAGLPSVEVTSRVAAGARTVRVTWRAQSGAPAEVVLTGFSKAGAK